MATQTTGGGSTTSFSNTPQAVDDIYSWSEDQLLLSSSYNASTYTLTLDVMANDLGGKAKTLFSVDDGDGNAITADYELLTTDINAAGTSAWELTRKGNWVRINNGKIEFRISDGSGVAGAGADINSLSNNANIDDEFVYAIRLGNGTLSEATVSLKITGTNDGPVVNAVAQKYLVEQTDTSTLSTSIGVTFTDVDLADTGHTASITGISKTGVVAGLALSDDQLKALITPGAVTKANGSANGSVNLAFAAASTAFDYLATGQKLTLTYTVAIDDGNSGTVSQDVTITVTGTNDAPVITSAAQSGAVDELADGASGENSTLLSASGAVAFSDVDLSDDHSASVTATTVDATLANGHTLTLLQQQALVAAFSIDTAAPSAGGTGTVDWHYDVSDADLDFLGATDSVELTFTVTVDDGNSGTVSQDVTITVTGTNDAPVITQAIANQSINEDNAWSYTVPTGTFTDVDGDTLTYLATLNNGDPLPAWLTFTAATQSFSGTPPQDFNGSLDIKATVSDGSANVSNTFKLTINPVNDAPVTSGSATLGTIAEDTASPLGATVTALFSGNFSDAADQVAGGSSANSFAGIAISSYTVDASKGNWQYSTNDGASWISLASTSGNAAITLDATALLRFVPAADYTGSTTGLSVNLIESGLTVVNGATIDLTGATGGATHISAGTVALSETISEVNDAPVTNDDVLSTVAEDSATCIISFASLLINDSNGPANETGQTLTITALSNVVGGTAVIDGTDIKFTPAASFNGTASFDYTVTDNGMTNGSADPKSDQGHVSFAVTAINDAPINFMPTGYTTNEDSSIKLSGLSVTDVDAGSGTIQVTLSVANGTITAADGGGVTAAGSGSSSVMLSGTLTAINTYLATAASQPTYVPVPNANGTVQLTMATTDNGNTGTPGALGDSDTISINVTALNDAPSGADKTVTTNEDTAYTFTTTDFGFTDPNDSPANVLLAVKITQLPASGTLFYGANGGSPTDAVAVSLNQSVSAADIIAGKLFFSPAANANGNGYASFKFAVQDDGGTAAGGVDLDPTPNTISINVTAVNDAPVNSKPGAQSVNEDTNLVFSTANGNAITVSDADVNEIASPNNTVQVALNVASGTLTLGSTSGISITVGANGTGSMTLQGTLTNVNAALNGLTYKGNLDFNGTDTLNIVSSDLGHTGAGGPLTDSDSVSITINPVNDAPVATGSTTLTAINEDTTSPTGARVASLFGGNFSDAADQVTGGSTANTFAGIAISSYTADASKGNWQYSTNAGGSWTSLGSGTTASAITLDSSALLRFVPATNYNGPATALNANLIESGLAITNGGTLNLTGATGGSTHISSATVALSETINPVNDAPVNSKPGAQNVNANTNLVFSNANGTAITVSDVDVNETASPNNTVQVALSVASGTLTLGTVSGISITAGANATGSVTIQGTLTNINAALDGLTYRGNLNFNGADTLSIVSSDFGHTGSGGPLTDSDSVSITVNAVNAAPVITAIGDGGAIGGADHIVSSQVNDNLVIGTAGAGRTVIVKLGATTLGTAIADGSGNWTYSLTATNITTLGQGIGKTITATTSDGTSTGFVFSVDTIATVAITSTNLANQQGSTSTVTFNFGETVTGFTIADISTSDPTRATISGLTGGPSSYTATATRGANNGSVQVTVAAGSYSDLAGNSGQSGTSPNLPAGVSGSPIILALDHPAGVGEVSVTISSLPDGWVMNGAVQQADGSWIIQTSDLTTLSVTTPLGYVGAHVLEALLSWGNADGSVSTILVASNVEAYAPGNPIFAWSGDDTLTGSANADAFVFAQPIGSDKIFSFDVVADKVDLIGYSALASFADVMAHMSEDAAGNARLDLAEGQSITFVGVHSADLSAANFVFDETPVTTNSGTIQLGNGSILPISGMIANSGTINLQSTGDSTLLQLIQYGVTLTGGGHMQLSDSTGNEISGTLSSVTLTNEDNVISGAGHIGAGSLTLINAGTIEATGVNLLVIDTGDNIILNSGTLGASGLGGLQVVSAIDNQGLINIDGSHVLLNGNVSGSGDVVLDGTASVEFGADASSDVVLKATASGLIQFDESIDFSGTIAGLNHDDRVDLMDIAFDSSSTTFSYFDNGTGAGGVLTVSDGVHTTHLTLIGSYHAEDFSIGSNGHGGTLLSFGM